MADMIVERWQPSTGHAERPAEIFNLNWQGSEQRLVVTVRFATNLDEEVHTATATVTFEDVLAFKVLDEDMDSSEALTSLSAQLTPSFPYGGRWPFLEVFSSGWVADLTRRHGAWSENELRHLIITSRNMHLHVACRKRTDG
jgi:hypothetical protein